MTHRVAYTDQFIENVRAHVGFLRTQRIGDDRIERWYGRLFERLDLLSEWPCAHPVDERYSAEVGHEVRKVNFGNYIAFYRLDETFHRVEVLSFIHGASRR